MIKLKFKSAWNSGSIFDNKERLQKISHERYQSPSKEEKEKKQQYGCERYQNLSENEKQKPVEYRKKYYRMTKNALL